MKPKIELMEKRMNAPSKGPSRKTLRVKLRLKRKQLAGASVVVPSTQLAQVIGHEPRTREEAVIAVRRYIEEHNLTARSGRWVHADEPLASVFKGMPTVRASDVHRMVILNLRHPRFASRMTSLPGDPVTPFPPPPKRGRR
jgi:chromatin remodeling complex protein RSC6